MKRAPSRRGEEADTSRAETREGQLP
jgi:hypothetical protein